MTSIATIGMADAKTNFSKITADVNRTGIPVVVFKNNKPWVEIRPLSSESSEGVMPSDTKMAMMEAETLKTSTDAPVFQNANDLFNSLGI